MSTQVDVRILELLSARLCHELIGPVGAIDNGVELLGEDDPEFVRAAVAMIGESARKAANRLRFYRFAYGTLTAASAGHDPRSLVAGLLEGDKIAADWSDDAAALASEWLKLGCNMFVLAAEALPRGGTVRIATPAAGRGLTVAAHGEVIKFTGEARAAVARTAAPAELTPRTVQSYFTAHLAERLGAQLVAAVEPGELLLSAIG